MRYCISSVFILALCETSLFNYFHFATAADESPRTRSTPAPTTTKNESTNYFLYSTQFDVLPFWSGESLKVKKPDENDTSNNTRRKNNKEDSPGAVEALSDGSLNHTHEVDNLKLNGYTLRRDMEKLLALVDANVTIKTIGTTIEQHEIILCQLSKKPANYFRALEGDDKYVVEAPQKKIILIVHGLSPMGFRIVPCLHESEMFLQLVKMYAEHLDKFDIFLVPMANPDGIQDETLDIWNKNKSPQVSCSGVNVDRNFDVGWNKTANINTCSQEYPGPRPFSELESRAVADLIHHYNPKIAAYIHVHAGTYRTTDYKGDAVLYPKGYTDQADDDKYDDIKSEIEDVLRMAGFRVYGVFVTSMYDWYGPAPGTSVDYATSVYGIPYGMEFVMQPYAVEGDSDNSEEVSNIVLNHVWKKIIDTIFNNIYKNYENKVQSN